MYLRLLEENEDSVNIYCSSFLAEQPNILDTLTASHENHTALQMGQKIDPWASAKKDTSDISTSYLCVDFIGAYN